MQRQRGLPFRFLMMMRIGVLVMALTAAFLFYVLERVQERVQESGRENFQMLANAAFGGLDALMQSNLQYLTALTQMLPAMGDLVSEEDRRALGGSFLEKTGANALTVVWPDDEMLYFLKRDPEAPAGTLYTEGHLRVRAGQGGLISVRYRAADQKIIARRDIPIDLHPARNDWNLGAQRFGRYMSAMHPIPGREDFAITMAARTGDKIVGLVTPLKLIDYLLSHLHLSQNGAVVLIDEQQRMAGLHVNGERWLHRDIRKFRLQSLHQIGDPVLAAAASATETLVENQISLVNLAGEEFLLAWHNAARIPGVQYRLLLLVPLDDLSQIAHSARWDAWIVALFGLAITLPLSWISAGTMAKVLQGLVRNSQEIGRMEFSGATSSIRSSVLEVQQLGAAHEAMRAALAGQTRTLRRVSGHLERLVDIGIHLGEQRDQESLLRTVLAAASEMSGAQIGVIFLRDEEGMLRAVESMGLPPSAPVPVFDLNDPEREPQSLAVRAALSGATQVVEDPVTDMQPQLAPSRRLAKEAGIEVRSMVALAMHADRRPVIGVMQLYNATNPDSGRIAPFTASQISYLESLAAQAAVVLEQQKLVASQDHLLDTLVRTLGDAVDAKSEFTGRHCARVPQLAMMLAREAHNASSGALADFSFRSDDQWREFRTGAWLHDCGKITTPEHLLDKATKLETVYNRLHEIRTRFEVLLRDARIEALQAQLDGRMDAQAAMRFSEERQQLLMDDYAFVAACNLGSEGMSHADVDRLRLIAQKRWWRHFDDRLGLSWLEAGLRKSDGADECLPVEESLIADKPWHLIPRSAELQRHLTEGFNMEVPEYLYNHGELYNLSVQRGTLTKEERFKVNEHIIHTLRMLEGAQFPAHLRRVPEYAGTHHETLDGGGYPRSLKGDQLSVPARIMAIADIFEALTAADRPYKTPKPLSESLRILQGLKNKGKIDADLFALFLQSGVYRRYAERFLQPEQIDVSDITPYLA
ncbi:MAG: GAF domain-containing protein [Rhizobium sp.]|nr:MAG: GAF domain-containing protein [Rhizobium sp.]